MFWPWKLEAACRFGPKLLISAICDQKCSSTFSNPLIICLGFQCITKGGEKALQTPRQPS